MFEGYYRKAHPKSNLCEVSVRVYSKSHLQLSLTYACVPGPYSLVLKGHFIVRVLCIEKEAEDSEI
jgi:hypothetical protein